MTPDTASHHTAPHDPGSADPDARFWDRAARKYAASRIGDEAAYERTLARTRALLGPADAVLELGCGTGTTALRLAPHVGRLFATDVSPEMIAIARERAAAAGETNATFSVAAADTTPTIPGAFDAVLAFNLLHLLPDRAAALRRAHGLLRPGGLLVTKTPCLSEMNPLIRLLVPAMRLVGKAPFVSFFDGPALEREMEVEGFTIEERARHGSGRRDPRVFLVARRD